MASGHRGGHGGAQRYVASAAPLPSRRVIALDAATVLLQWAVGGMAFCWFTTRRREVGLGYGWLLRGIYLLMAVGAFLAGVSFGAVPVREVASLGVAAGVPASVSSCRSPAAGPASPVSAPSTTGARPGSRR